MYCQGSVVEQAAAREHLEDGEPEQRSLERHHRDPARLETEVGVGAGEQYADNESDDDGSELQDGRKETRSHQHRQLDRTAKKVEKTGRIAHDPRRTVSSSSSSSWSSPTLFLTSSRGRDPSNLSRLLRDPVVVRAIFLVSGAASPGPAIRRLELYTEPL